MNGRLPRSPHLLNRGDSALLVVDIQEKLMPFIPHGTRLTWNVKRLIAGAKCFEIPVVATEQYPQGLGPTISELASELPTRPDKVLFSCGACGELFERLAAEERTKIVVAGIETHVCVLQTTLDLLAAGFSAVIPVDAVGSRASLDYDCGLRRMETCGATLSTTETILFEWCESSADPQFKEISRLVRESPPGE